jgi:hypothetical protein
MKGSSGDRTKVPRRHFEFPYTHEVSPRSVASPRNTDRAEVPERHFNSNDKASVARSVASPATKTGKKIVKPLQAPSFLAKTARGRQGGGRSDTSNFPIQAKCRLRSVALNQNIDHPAPSPGVGLRADAGVAATSTSPPPHYPDFDRLIGAGFRAVFVDPPWLHRSNSEAAPGRNPRRYYPCLTVEQLCRLPLIDCVADDAVLFLAVPGPQLVIGAYLPVVEAWGFKPTATLRFAENELSRSSETGNRQKLASLFRSKPAKSNRKRAFWPKSRLVKNQ